jgi:hypothetical protein
MIERVTLPSADLPLRTFAAWVWVPWRLTRVRGLPIAYLDVYPHRLHVRPEPLLRRLSGVPEFDYSWPAVVVERLWVAGLVPTPAGRNLLVDLGGELASVAVTCRTSTLVGALTQAGFRVIQVRHNGWEAPHPASRAELGDAVSLVPPSVSLGT